LPQTYFFSSFFSSIGAAGAGDDGVAAVEPGDAGELGAAEEEGADDGALELGAFFDDDCSPHAARASAAAAAISRVLVIAGSLIGLGAQF